MRQLITRIDDELHERLTARARAEGRSLASFVREVLANAVGARPDREALRQRLARSDLVVRPDPPGAVPPRVEALRATRGAGTTASEALADDRGAR